MRLWYDTLVALVEGLRAARVSACRDILLWRRPSASADSTASHTKAAAADEPAAAAMCTWENFFEPLYAVVTSHVIDFHSCAQLLVVMYRFPPPATVVVAVPAATVVAASTTTTTTKQSTPIATARAVKLDSSTSPAPNPRVLVAPNATAAAQAYETVTQVRLFVRACMRACVRAFFRFFVALLLRSLVRRHCWLVALSSLHVDPTASQPLSAGGA